MDILNKKIISEINDYILLIGGSNEFALVMNEYDPTNPKQEILGQLSNITLREIDRVKSEIEERFERLNKLKTIKIKVSSTH